MHEREHLLGRAAQEPSAYVPRLMGIFPVTDDVFPRVLMLGVRRRKRLLALFLPPGLNRGSGLGLVFLQVPPHVFADVDTPQANETPACLPLPALAKACPYFMCRLYTDFLKRAPQMT